jgi:Fic family protein
MDAKLFGSNKTGVLLPIRVSSGEDYAFIPNALPPDWSFGGKLWPLLTEAHKRLGMLDGIGRTLPDPQLLLSPLGRDESIASSRLEGTYATAQEMLLFELDRKEQKSQAADADAWKEVSNYNKALASGTQTLMSEPISLNIVKDLHAKLLTGVRGTNARPGEFREHQVHIGSTRRYIPPPKEEIKPCLDQLASYINEGGHTQFDPLVRAYLVHYQFEAIHPFADGNGRIGRIVLALMTWKWCGHQMPWLYMSAFFEKYKKEYIDNLFRVSTEGDWDTWIEFCLNGTIQQANEAISRCNLLRLLKEDMHKRARSGGSPRTHMIIDGLFSNPIVRPSTLCREHQVAYATAAADIQRLVKMNILEELPNIRPIAFYSKEIFSIAYSNPHQPE